MSEFKRFKSIGGDVPVSNIFGHCAVITSEWTVVHKSLWGEAYANGTIPEEVAAQNLKSYVKEQKEIQALEDEEKEKKLKAKLLEIYESPNDYVNKTGDLILRKVSGYLKEPVKADLILKIWDEIIAENK